MNIWYIIGVDIFLSLVYSAWIVHLTHKTYRQQEIINNFKAKEQDAEIVKKLGALTDSELDGLLGEKLRRGNSKPSS